MYKIGKDEIKAAVVTIARRQETLRCSSVSPFSKRCDKSRKVAVGLTQRYAMITIPSVCYSFASVCRNYDTKVVQTLGVVLQGGVWIDS